MVVKHKKETLKGGLIKIEILEMEKEIMMEGKNIEKMTCLKIITCPQIDYISEN